MPTRISQAISLNTTAGPWSAGRAARLLLGLLLITLPAAVHAQFNYITNNGAITITGYNCADGTADIPSTINGLPVTTIGVNAFAGCSSLTSVTIPDSVTTIGDRAFYGCTGLMAINVAVDHSTFGSVDGVLFSKSLTTLVKCPGGKTGSYTIPDHVTSIAKWAFYGCTSLTSVTIPNSVTTIGYGTFWGCFSLSGVYFRGNSPSIFGGGPLELRNKLFDDEAVIYSTAYYLPGTTGWHDNFSNCAMAHWLLPYPVILSSGPDFGATANGFGFLISWATNASVVVESSPNLPTPVWTPVSTNTLTAGSSQFTDPQWTDHPARLYRLVTQ